MGDSATVIRTEQLADMPQMRLVNQLAFGQPAEADVVDRLRRAVAPADALSLVAKEDGVVVGHILFTAAVVEDTGRRIVGMRLAPLAVLPDQQRQGIGAALVRRGLVILRERRKSHDRYHHALTRRASGGRPAA
jgi:putative acetyltransferase